jgi:hypothetical protein
VDGIRKTIVIDENNKVRLIYKEITDKALGI